MRFFRSRRLEAKTAAYERIIQNMHNLQVDSAVHRELLLALLTDLEALPLPGEMERRLFVCGPHGEPLNG